MTRQEFMTEINGYYGFKNEFVVKKFIQKLNQIAESDLDRLLDWFMENVQANWNVDYQVLEKGIKACCIFLIVPKKRCPICKATNNETARLCFNCGYDFRIPVEQYQNQMAKPEDVARFFGNLARNMAEKKEEIQKMQKDAKIANQ